MESTLSVQTGSEVLQSNRLMRWSSVDNFVRISGLFINTNDEIFFTLKNVGVSLGFNTLRSQYKIRAGHAVLTLACLACPRRKTSHPQPVELPDNIEKREINCIFNIAYVLCRQLFFGVISFLT